MKVHPEQSSYEFMITNGDTNCSIEEIKKWAHDRFGINPLMLRKGIKAYTYSVQRKLPEDYFPVFCYINCRSPRIIKRKNMEQRRRERKENIRQACKDGLKTVFNTFGIYKDIRDNFDKFLTIRPFTEDELTEDELAEYTEFKRKNSKFNITQ
jgi:hypothetical protein